MSISYNADRLVQAVDRFSGLRLLVIGDVMLDEFVWGKVRRISPEAPVPVVDVTHETRLLGGAANTLNNVVSVGADVILTGIVGRDEAGDGIRNMLRELGREDSGIITVDSRPTTIKTRVVAHAQQVVRVDRESRKPLDGALLDRLREVLESWMGRVDAVIVSDYGKGVVSAEVMDEVRRLCKKHGRLVAVDPKVNNFALYRDVSVITPNHLEAEIGSGVTIDSEESLILAGWKILEDLNCESVLVTRGEQGMTLFERNRPPAHIPTVAREVFDVTGAGDTVIAILTLGLAAGLTLNEAAVLANFAAGEVVGEVGTSTVTAERLKKSVWRGGDGLDCVGKDAKGKVS